MGYWALSLQGILQWAPGSLRQNYHVSGLHSMLFRAPGATSLKIRENHHGNCLGCKGSKLSK